MYIADIRPVEYAVDLSAKDSGLGVDCSGFDFDGC